MGSAMTSGGLPAGALGPDDMPGDVGTQGFDLDRPTGRLLDQDGQGFRALAAPKLDLAEHRGMDPDLGGQLCGRFIVEIGG